MVASTPSSAHALITKRERCSKWERGGEKEQEGDNENESERAWQSKHQKAAK